MVLRCLLFAHVMECLSVLAGLMLDGEDGLTGMAPLGLFVGSVLRDIHFVWRESYWVCQSVQ